MNAPHFRKTLLGCGIAAAVETLLVLSISEPAILFFVLGPLAFVIVIAWRRRTHLARSRRIHGVAVGIASFGIAMFGVAFLMHRRDPQADSAPVAPLIVPLVQWLVVLYVWIAIARAESREKQAGPSGG